MRTHIDIRALGSRGALMFVITASVASAQLPNASPAATGMGGAYTALARGYHAVAWNPANLGLADNPGFSIGLLALNGASGLDPISLSDIAPYSGKQLPAAQREQWLQTVTGKTGENGRINGGLTELGLSAGPFALQVATSVGASAKLNPDAVEALLFGNAGRTGQPKNLNLQGSNLRVGAFTTGGLSYGVAVGGDQNTGSQFAIGITGKYTVGHFLAMAQDQGSTTTTDAVNVNFPLVYSNPDSSKSIGSGFGLDLGLAWAQDKWRFGGTVQNVFNTFKWDATKLVSKAGTALFNANGNATNFDDQPYGNAPETLRARVTNDQFKPIVGVGLGYGLNSVTTLSADAREQIGDGISTGPKTQVGAGIEFRGVPLLRLRGGGAYITDGWAVSGGVGLALGRYELGVGAALRTVNSGKEPVITVNVLSIK